MFQQPKQPNSMAQLWKERKNNLQLVFKRSLLLVLRFLIRFIVGHVQNMDPTPTSQTTLVDHGPPPWITPHF